jgi:ribosomal protein L14
MFKIGTLVYGGLLDNNDDAQIDCTDDGGAKVFIVVVTVDELSFGNKKALPDEICCAVKDNEPQRVPGFTRTVW